MEIKVYQQDWMPGFAALMDDGRIREDAKAHVVLNLGSLLAAVEGGHMEKKDIPYFVAECLMHEIIHALESWAEVEFSEERIEALLERYRAKYGKA